MVVARVAGTPSLSIRRKALLAMTFLTSSGLPARASLSGFIEHTYPDMMKNMVTARYPPSSSNRKTGSVRK